MPYAPKPDDDLPLVAAGIVLGVILGTLTAMALGVM